MYWDLNRAAWVTADGDPVLPVEQFEDEVAELAAEPSVIEAPADRIRLT